MASEQMATQVVLRGVEELAAKAGSSSLFSKSGRVPRLPRSTSMPSSPQSFASGKAPSFCRLRSIQSQAATRYAG